MLHNKFNTEEAIKPQLAPQQKKHRKIQNGTLTGENIHITQRDNEKKTTDLFVPP